MIIYKTENVEQTEEFKKKEARRQDVLLKIANGCKQMPRIDCDALKPVERLAFIHSGGKVV
jgi:hypothetical protein